ncbi:MAG: hypothetical protein QF805_02615 [Pirellulaceae bacterium]|nr:hypothetical protein [Pirellulaceae bacterium]
MVWVSFFAHPSKMARFDKPKELAGYLVRMARNKVAGAQRRGCGPTRDYKRNVPLASDVANVPGDQTPSQFAIARGERPSPKSPRRWEYMSAPSGGSLRV